MSLYNEIKNHFRMENAFRDWEGYRNTLTDYLIYLVDNEEINLDHVSTISFPAELPTFAIVGAGACNDIDLKRLLPYFSKITLIDIDEAAIDAGLRKYGLQDCDLLEKKILSLHYITQEDYEEFTRSLQSYVNNNLQCITPESFCDYATDYIHNLYKNRQASVDQFFFGEYDYVWCFGVHSQLQSMFGYIYNSFLLNLKEEFFENEVLVEKPFFDALRKVNRTLVPCVNDILIQCANKYCIIGNEWDVVKNREKEYVMNPFPLHAVEGAYQAICDVRQRDITCQEKLLLWPFDEQRGLNYMVLIQQIKK